jgi:DNA polymerase-1
VTPNERTAPVLGGFRVGDAPAPADEDVQKIDTSVYACVRDLPTLEQWIAKARTKGVVAFDTETDGFNSATSDICGVSLAVAPGEACYIPLGHAPEDQGLELEARATLERGAEAAAGGPGGAEDRPERQVRHRRPGPLRRRRRPDR